MDESSNKKSSRACDTRGLRACRSVVMRATGALTVAGLIAAGNLGVAGHSVGHYPSYYPHEIRIAALDPSAAAKELGSETLHAYLGAAPAFAAQAPKHVRALDSLGAFLILSFDINSARFATADARCRSAREILSALSKENVDGFVFYPYPVTPYHSDYLHHLDRIEAAIAASDNGAAAPSSLNIDARGRIAEAIIRPGWRLAAGTADIRLDEVSATELMASAGARFDGWAEPPWRKEGWFQAYQVLAPGLDTASREEVDEIYEYLTHGEITGLAQRVNFERDLVAALGKGCERIVAGYAPRQEYVDESYPAGIENGAHDSLGGLNSPLFFRTVKLKEYPWNGTLQLAVRDRPAAAWNPVAGFNDAMGQAVWSAVGDPAMIQFPFNASWMPNRVQAAVTKVEGQSAGMRVPADAIRPQLGTGMLQPVGPRTFGAAKVIYEVLTSPFEDGTEMDVADIIYPFAFAYRWGAKADPTEKTYEPRLATTFAAMRESLAGLRIVRIETSRHTIAENMTVVQKVPVVEVHLRHAAGDDRQIAAAAPPWSTVPWHLLALMEEAVIRGYAAFSEEEAGRRNVPWLDLVRDETLKTKLLDLAAQFERDGYRPAPLQQFVSAEDAQARWRALRVFAETKGHFLVTNGPYRLKEWTPTSVVLQAVRDITYPLGFGTFDRFANPPKAIIDTVMRDKNAIIVGARAVMPLKMGRDYKVVTEPLSRNTMRGTFGMLVASRYLLLDQNGAVLEIDKMDWRDDGRFVVRLPEGLKPGQYTTLFAVFLDGNATLASARILRFRIGGIDSPG